MKYLILVLFFGSCAFFEYANTGMLEYPSEVKNPEITKEASNIIKVLEDDVGFVKLSINKYPHDFLLGVPEDEILYCINTAPVTEMFINQNTELMFDGCDNWVSYSNLNRIIELGDLEFLNIFAKFNEVIFPYQRIVLSENIVFTSECNFTEYEKVYVLKGALVCEGEDINNVYILGNGNSIDLINSIDLFQFNFIANTKISASSYFANYIYWSSLENNTFNNRGAITIGDTNFFSNLFYSYSDNYNEFEQGIVAGKIVDNYQWSRINNNKVYGTIYNGSIVGGLIGFVITFSEIKQNEINVNLSTPSPMYSGCIYGVNIDMPELFENIENCTFKK
jgi:hypothetical protein